MFKSIAVVNEADIRERFSGQIPFADNSWELCMDHNPGSRNNRVILKPILAL